MAFSSRRYFNAATVTLLVTARFNHHRESVGVIAGVMAEGKLIQVERQILLGDVVVGPDDAALEQRERGFDSVAMNPGTGSV